MEFIFALVISAGLAVLLFSVSYTLAVVEVTQYVAYSTARAHLGSNKDPAAQKKAAIDKFKHLVAGKSAISSLYAGNWFEIGKPDELPVRGGPSADGKTFGDDLAGGSDEVQGSKRNWFIGVSVPLKAKILTMNLPLLGRTNPEDDDGSFSTRLNAMLIREPSQKECKDFFEKRRTALGNLPSGAGFYQQNAYVPMEDNGC
ncbi:MAG: hypothetical protein KF681_15645 [Bdellovibrionaceae bacterium]|nr:hypothetical protein [Pseudobdellovibrionaceae bacterium]